MKPNAITRVCAIRWDFGTDMNVECDQTLTASEPTMSSSSAAAPAYRVESNHFDRKEKLAPKGRYFTLQLGTHKITVQAGPFVKPLKSRSKFLRACLHLDTEHGERRFLAIVASIHVPSAKATIGDLQALVASVQLHRCLDCSETYVLDPAFPKRYICWACHHLRKVRLAGNLLLAESGHLTRRTEAIDQAQHQGMTHVVIRRKHLRLSLERFASVPQVLRAHLCTLEVTRFTVGVPLTDAIEALFAVYKGPLNPPDEAVILPLQDYRDQTVQRKAIFEDMLHKSKGLRERAGATLIKQLKQMKQLKHAHPSVEASGTPPARARPKRMSISVKLAELVK